MLLLELVVICSYNAVKICGRFIWCMYGLPLDSHVESVPHHFKVWKRLSCAEEKWKTVGVHVGIHVFCGGTCDGDGLLIYL